MELATVRNGAIVGDGDEVAMYVRRVSVLDIGGPLAWLDRYTLIGRRWNRGPSDNRITMCDLRLDPIVITDIATGLIGAVAKIHRVPVIGDALLITGVHNPGDLMAYFIRSMEQTRVMSSPAWDARLDKESETFLGLLEPGKILRSPYQYGGQMGARILGGNIVAFDIVKREQAEAILAELAEMPKETAV